MGNPQSHVPTHVVLVLVHTPQKTFSLTWPELPKHSSTKLILLELASLFTARKEGNISKHDTPTFDGFFAHSEIRHEIRQPFLTVDCSFSGKLDGPLSLCLVFWRNRSHNQTSLKYCTHPICPPCF